MLFYIDTAATGNLSGAILLTHSLKSSMKLHLTKAPGNQLITGYGAGWIQVNELRYTQSLIVLPELVITDWDVQAFGDLTEVHFEKLIEATSGSVKLEVLLLGTGEKHQFIHPKLSRALIDAGIGIECMDTAAACRTYNILMAEGRNVAAALII